MGKNRTIFYNTSFNFFALDYILLCNKFHNQYQLLKCKKKLAANTLVQFMDII